MASGFGRKIVVDEELAAKRAAFIASERARAAREPDEPVQTLRTPTRAAAGARAPVYADDKTLFAAYMNWFLFGFVGAHRFYLGYTLSGALQAMLGMVGLALLFTAAAQESLAYASLSISVVGTSGLWLLGDLVLIPTMCARANAKLRRRETKRGFALD